MLYALKTYFFYTNECLNYLLILFQYEPKDKPFIKQVTYWLACLINPNTPVILSHEHQGYEWLPLTQAKIKAEYPEMQELLDECENYLTRCN